MNAIEKRLNAIIGKESTSKEECISNDYRLLREGDIIQVDDEYYLVSHGWIRVSSINRNLGKEWGDDFAPFRRKTNYDIENGESAVKILNELGNDYFKEDFFGVFRYKLFKIICELKKGKIKICKILCGEHKGEIGIILFDKKTPFGEEGYELKLSSGATYGVREDSIEII